MDLNDVFAGQVFDRLGIKVENDPVEPHDLVETFPQVNFIQDITCLYDRAEMDLASLQNETHRPNFNRLGFSFVKVIVALLEKMKAYELRFHIQVDVTRQNPPTISSLLWYENILTMIESFKSRLAVIGPNDPLISYNITNLIAKIVNVKDDYRNHMRYRFEGIHLDYL